MASSVSTFEQLEQELARGGKAAVLEQLAQQLREQGNYHELFEALKMQVRQRLGLALLYNDSGEELEGTLRDQLEDGLIEACREVGVLLMRDGKVREAWMYLRPVGNASEAAKELGEVEVTDDNLDELIEVALHEGVDPGRGFGLVLSHYGTCNAITTFESVMARQDANARKAAAAMLVKHLHEELVASVVADISRQEGQEPESRMLADLVKDREWLFGEMSYHIDTTHLSSTVRFARILDDDDALKLARDLTEYGRRLSSQFQYPGEEPFVDLYPAHALFLDALLGDNVDEAIDYFREKAEQLNVAEHGMQPIEVYLELLDRLGRYDEAVGVLVRLAQEKSELAQQVTQLLLEFSKKSGNFAPLLQLCREREDLLGFTTALLESDQPQASA